MIGSRVKRIHPAVVDRLQTHRWPGNVRMLDNIIMRSLIFCDNRDELDFVLLEDDDHGLTRTTQPLPATGNPPPAPLPAADGQSLETQVAAYEKDLLLHYLKRYPNLSEAARQCGIPRATLQYKMKKHGIRLTQQVVDN